ncbi:GmrSD restriction endonuclease domain-containing protein [Ruminococcus sp.]|uniref:GmrSD restriction endonuclease domain-containing protein n=1 Tax=Ruminococcus sp. TaxID=41978 RepID=UPI003AB2F862
MAINIAPKSLDTELSELMREVSTGKEQLPEFQRGWTWDNDRIRGIIASLSQGYPMGAIMRLEYGNENVRFKYRTIEGVTVTGVTPEFLILDGQQRLTSMYRATCCKEPVETTTEKGKEIKRFYYLDIKKCLDESEDRVDAVIAVPSDRKIKTNFDRDVVLDLSTRELEFEHEMFPINIIFDSNAREDWADGYKEYHEYDKAFMEKYKQFRTQVIDTIVGYKLPVITLGKETPREAVCKVFENVNTGGVPLTVFELVTATFATYDFDLRKDWIECRDKIRGKGETLNTDVMEGVDETSFLTAITLYTTYLSDKMTTSKKKDVLALNFEDYKKNRDILLEGYKMARKFLFQQYVFRKRDLPYTTQLIPLSAICAVIRTATFNLPSTQKILAKWFWCGIMGEMYGGANETRYATDIEDVVADIQGKDSQNRTINAAYFSATRLLSLQTRNSAAYKGIMALVYREQCRDFMQGITMDIVKSMDESPDIHHIFPEAYCKKMGLDKSKWNSIVNKTPLLPASNRQIGGDAPSVYSGNIMKKAEIDEVELRFRIESHLVNYDYLIADDFDHYFIARAKAILKVIEAAMGKTIADKGSEQTIKEYGCSLEDNAN